MNAALRRLLPALLALAALSGCGKRGDPLPPLKRTPQPVSALRLAQRGSLIEISYQAPRAWSDGSRLPVLEVELIRADREGELTAVGTSSVRSVAPGEPIVEALPAPPAGTVLRVAARARVKKLLSPLASLPAFTVQAPPARPENLAAAPATNGLALTWTPPADGPGAGTLVYRRDKLSRFGRPLTPQPLAQAGFEDTAVAQGQEWCYVVRRVASTDPPVESAASNEACAVFRDVVAPAAPGGLAALPQAGGLQLSWSPSPEPDLAHYRVYRLAAGGRQLVQELAPGETGLTVGDASRRYVVTAVDTAGNESEPSAPVGGRP